LLRKTSFWRRRRAMLWRKCRNWSCRVSHLRLSRKKLTLSKWVRRRSLRNRLTTSQNRSNSRSKIRKISKHKM